MVPFPESILSTSASAWCASRGKFVSMTDADIFIGRSAPWLSSGIGGFAELLAGVPGFWGRRGLGRWLRVPDCGFEVGELCGERIGEDGFMINDVTKKERGACRWDGVKWCKVGELTEVGGTLNALKVLARTATLKVYC